MLFDAIHLHLIPYDTLVLYTIQASLGPPNHPSNANVPSLPDQVSFQTIRAGSGILDFRPCWCPSPFPLPSISRCFTIHTSSPAIVFHSCFFFTASLHPSLTHFLVEFPGLGLALVPNVVVPEAEQRCAWSRNLDPNFCPV